MQAVIILALALPAINFMHTLFDFSYDCFSSSLLMIKSVFNCDKYNARQKLNCHLHIKVIEKNMKMEQQLF